MELSTTEGVRLERLLFAIAQEVEADLLSEMSLEAHTDLLTGRMVYTLRAAVLAEKLAEQVVEVPFQAFTYFHFPRSVWQHWKRDHAPTWFVHRWPVLTEEHKRVVSARKQVRVEQFATFPATRIRMPENLRGQHVIRYERTEVT